MESEIVKRELSDEARQKNLTLQEQENSVSNAAPQRIFESENLVAQDSTKILIRIESLSDLETVRLWLNQKSRHTAHAYERVTHELLEFLTSMGKTLATAEPTDIINFCSFKNSQAKATVIQRAAIVKSLFTFGVRAGRFKNNPSLIVRFKRAPHKIASRTLSEEQVRGMMATARSDLENALVRILYNSGARRAEVIALNWWSFLEKESGGARISIMGKGGIQREVLISKTTWEAVKKLRSEGTQGSDPVFVTNYGKKMQRISESAVFKIIKRLALRAEIAKKVSPHSLRHAHASHSLKKGASLVLIQETLGHASIEMTGRYLHADPDRSSSEYLDD